MIRLGYSRWRNSYSPHADGTDRGNPRDAGDLYACRIAYFYAKKKAKNQTVARGRS